MSNRQFWSYLGLEFIYKTTFGKLFYMNISNLTSEGSPDENSKNDYINLLF